MRRLKGVKEKRDHYSASLAVLGSQCSGAGRSAAQLAMVARTTMLGSSMTGARTRSPVQAGCLEKGRGQCRVSALGRAPRASLGATGGSEAGWRGRSSSALRPSPLAAQANVTCGGCDGGRYSPLRDALEPQNLILNQSVAFWKTSSLRARPLTDDEFAISLGNWTW